MGVGNTLKSAPSVKKITDPEVIDKTYRYWRNRILYTSMIGYALFYFVRKNLSLAMPSIEAELGVTKAQLGIFLTLHLLLYGLSRFTNGFFADRANPKIFMSLGLLLSAIMSICFGMSSTAMAFGLFWLFNGWFQGMGFPPCAKSLSNWFAPKERGIKFSIWNTSHSIGAGLVLLLNSYLVVRDWRLCFYVPGALAIVCAVFLYFRLADTPESMGLPPVEEYMSEDDDKAETQAGIEENAEVKEEVDFKTFIWKNIFTNPAIWIISFANFFLYIVRYAILDWGPTFLTETKGTDITQAGWITAAYEISGIVGMLVSGWMMDKVFKGKGCRACFVYMVSCAFCIFLFWYLPIHSMLLNALLLCTIGFFIYGPQCLVGVIAANIATKRAAATANGVTGIFGYMSGIVSGWGLGALVEAQGWDGGFLMLIVAAALAALMFLFTWNVKYTEV